MSVHAIAWALDCYIADPLAKLVLVGLANHADKYGAAAFPSHAMLADYASCSTRSIPRKLSDLLADGWIVRGDQQLVDHRPANRRPVVYDLTMSTPRGVQQSPQQDTSGVTDSHPSRGDSLSPQNGSGVTGQVVWGDRPGSSGVTAVSDKPSFNRPEPTRARAHASGRRVDVEHCLLCDDHGYAGPQLCDHDPGAGARARAAGKTIGSLIRPTLTASDKVATT